jgi:GntR family transcriptional regulator, transcriptional repressor for pyruvate dehydrogenase complex
MISLKKERVSMMVTDEIKEIVKNEDFKIGDKFYSENQLAKRLQVSRSSIREAIRMLEVTGYVKVYQGKGVFISQPGNDALPVKQWVVDNAELLGDHFEVRLLIEPHAAALAAKKADKKELVALRECYAAFCAFVGEGNVAKAIISDSHFHQLIAKATRNRTLSILMKTMAETLNEGWFASLNMPGRLEHTIGEHGALLEAIEKGASEEASNLMRTHLLNALADIQKHTGTLPN